MFEQISGEAGQPLLENVWTDSGAERHLLENVRIDSGEAEQHF
jgi:hypothetical protein